MTVKQMIDMLSKFDPKTRVKAWDPDSEQPEDVSGYLHDENRKTLELQTDVVW